ncbi:MAG: phosphonopyruvate decarboxylase [Candidatus Muiribacteriota bacterium]
MINVKDFYNVFKKNNINFFSGVPDSLLKDFCAYISDNTDEKNHIIAPNEGNAVALACGHYLATANPAVVYMQNSGIGNAVNPIISLLDEDVYKIPVIFIIGWRGEPGIKDEPQHKKQGKITLKLLETMGIDYIILDEKNYKNKLHNLIEYSKKSLKPVAVVVKKNSFESYKLQNTVKTDFLMSREEAVKVIIDNIEAESVVVSTTGKTSRELFEYREAKKQGHSKDFLTVGSMGHSSSIAFAIALEKPLKKVYCFDGDGAALMHMGALTINSNKKPANFCHILINNGAHDSVGGQNTEGLNVNFKKIAQGSGYKKVIQVKSAKEIIEALKAECDFIEIFVNKGARKDLGRPTTTPQENKQNFMRQLL